MTAASERLRAAVELLAVEPTEMILEVGCGHGVAADLICRRLTTGRLVAVDRSAKMITVATRRKAEHLAAGRLRLVQGVFGDPALDLGGPFDKIIAVHVAALGRGATEMDTVHRLLRPGGSLHLIFQPIRPEQTESLAAEFTANLGDHGFVVDPPALRSTSGAPAVCVRAVPG